VHGLAGVGCVQTLVATVIIAAKLYTHPPLAEEKTKWLNKIMVVIL
jgi:hypothetical protein